jgi:hypothetical protein
LHENGQHLNLGNKKTHRVKVVLNVVQTDNKGGFLDHIQSCAVDALGEEVVARQGPVFTLASGQGGNVHLTLGWLTCVVQDLLHLPANKTNIQSVEEYKLEENLVNFNEQNIFGG